MALTAIEALREIQAELAGTRVDEVPEGWRTTEDWASESGLARRTVSDILRDGEKAGLIERKQFKVMGSDGPRSLWHYRRVAR